MCLDALTSNISFVGFWQWAVSHLWDSDSAQYPIYGILTVSNIPFMGIWVSNIPFMGFWQWAVSHLWVSDSEQYPIGDS